VIALQTLGAVVGPTSLHWLDCSGARRRGLCDPPLGVHVPVEAPPQSSAAAAASFSSRLRCLPSSYRGLPNRPARATLRPEVGSSSNLFQPTSASTSTLAKASRPTRIALINTRMSCLLWPDALRVLQSCRFRVIGSLLPRSGTGNTKRCKRDQRGRIYQARPGVRLPLAWYTNDPMCPHRPAPAWTRGLLTSCHICRPSGWLNASVRGRHRPTPPQTVQELRT
jgi:hypothetical protein